MVIFLKDMMEEVLTNNGISIKAEKFEYNKVANILYAAGNIKIEDTKII